MEKTTFTNLDWFFYSVLPSKHCPIKDVRVLKNEYSLPEFLKLREYVDMMDAMEKASDKDNKATQPK